MVEQKSPEKTVMASQDELNVLLSIPSVYVNKIYASATPSGLQLSFAEIRTEPGQIYPRVAIILPFSSVDGLLASISQAMSNVEIHIEEIQK